MSLGIGIIGLSGSGRTTVFNALTGNKAETGGYGAASAAHVGMAKVPDARLEAFTKLYTPKKTTAAEIQYLDIGASVKALAKGGGSAGQLLTELAGVDALINVVRAFEDPAIPHPSGQHRCNARHRRDEPRSNILRPGDYRKTASTAWLLPYAEPSRRKSPGCWRNRN